MIHSIKINEFRGLNNTEIRLGKYITAISGKNGLGKSTILALVGNTCELKIKEGKTLFGTQFRTEFSEIFKADREFDKSGSNKCEINFSSLNNPERIKEKKICRVTWQKERFRIIPETKTEGEKNSRKKEWPSLYLGLSRLYPIGEADDDGIKVKGIKIDESDKEEFIKNYSEILNIKDDEISLDMIDINETKRKKGVGISTTNYSSITNSAGQDNVGQIILAVLSFSKLKRENSGYKGGLLLIDELDATLHPVAQKKLLNFLIKKCKSLNLQVIFTTHSISLLKDICIKTIHNKDELVNNCEIAYLTKNNGSLKVYRNPKFNIIENDLFIKAPGENIKKITVYTEDNEGRWLLENLLPNEYLLRVDLVKIKLACTELISLNNNDPKYFSNVLFVVDGDVQDKDINKSCRNDNIIKLPGKVRPEQVIYDFLMNLEEENPFWDNAMSLGLNKESLEEHGPLSSDYKGKDRDRFKKWFLKNQLILECKNVVEIWINENKDEYDKFLNNFRQAFNLIADRNLYPTI